MSCDLSERSPDRDKKSNNQDIDPDIKSHDRDKESHSTESSESHDDGFKRNRDESSVERSPDVKLDREISGGDTDTSLHEQNTPLRDQERYVILMMVMIMMEPGGPSFCIYLFIATAQ